VTSTVEEKQERIALRDVSLEFDGMPVLREVNLGIRAGEFVAVVGPSGCGKSTILNMCAGLLRPSRGSVHFQGLPVSAPNTSVAYITQDANLLPWLTVAQNVGLPLKLAGVPKQARAERVAQWLARVGLEGFEQHRPHQLSGGMQKRCAIARGLIGGPTAILMDEPFGALDAITRLLLQRELLRIWDQAENATVIFVTHDLSEAILLADRIVVMSRRPGRVLDVLNVPIPRPRNIAELPETAEFGSHYSKLWKLFKGEVEI
jgi:NitT/TauT family transport system ATP-binding protein